MSPDREHRAARATLMGMGEQTRYQVRFDWGVGGARAIGADSDVLVLVDAVPSAPEPDLTSIVPAAILRADFRTAVATARWIHALQQTLRRRVTIAVVAAGTVRPDGSLRADVEDLLAAGAVVRALGRLGIDATSPEAAATEAAFDALERAAGHLLTASVTAGTNRIGAGLARVDETLDASHAEVVRSHSEASATGAKSSANEFMQ